MKKILAFIFISLLALSACAKNTMPKKPDSDISISDQSIQSDKSEEKSSDWMEISNIQAKNLLASFKYSDDLFAQRSSGRWDVTNMNGFYSSAVNKERTHSFYWETSEKKTPVIELKAKELLMGGPVIDTQNQKIYLQFAKFANGDIANPEFSIWGFDFNNKLEFLDTYSSNDAQKKFFEKGLKAIDSKGNIYFGDHKILMCNSDYVLAAFSNNDAVYANKPLFVEEAKADCNGFVTANFEKNGEKLIEISTNDESKKVSIIVNSEQGKKTFEINKSPESVEPEYLALMPNSGLFVAPDHLKAVFIYFGEAALIDLKSGEIRSMKDEKLRSDIKVKQFGWIDESLYFENFETKKTYEIKFTTGEVKEINNLPANIRSTAAYNQTRSEKCEENGYFFTGQCLKDSPLVFDSAM
jgi:hypothetical protein